MYVKNNSGPKIEPCGSSDVTDNKLDLAPSMTTCCFLTVKWDFNQFGKSTLNQIFFNLCISNECGTLSS